MDPTSPADDDLRTTLPCGWSVPAHLLKPDDSAPVVIVRAGAVSRVLGYAELIAQTLELPFGHVEFEIVDGRVGRVLSTRSFDARDLPVSSDTVEIATEIVPKEEGSKGSDQRVSS